MAEETKGRARDGLRFLRRLRNRKRARPRGRFSALAVPYSLILVILYLGLMRILFVYLLTAVPSDKFWLAVFSPGRGGCSLYQLLWFLNLFFILYLLAEYLGFVLGEGRGASPRRRTTLVLHLSGLALLCFFQFALLHFEQQVEPLSWKLVEVELGPVELLPPTETPEWTPWLPDEGAAPSAAPTPTPEASRPYLVVHVFVALCDNEHQGIAPVPAALGDGRDPAGNLYWGALYGVKTFFTRAPHWTAGAPPAGAAREEILARAVFRSRGAGREVYVLAEAYDGARMETALTDFFRAAAGRDVVEAEVGSGAERLRLRAGGAADLVCFVGHNGLMDAELAERPRGRGGKGPEGAVVLACRSREYFVAPLRAAGCRPLITTTGLMAPEAYTLEAVIRSWRQGDPPETIRREAGRAYAKYQRISEGAGMRLFVAGEEADP